MTSSTVTLGSAARADLYQGTIRTLQGNQLLANVTRTDGHALQLQITLNLAPNTTAATGTLIARPLAGGP